MKMKTAKEIIEHGLQPAGFLVNFEWVKKGILESDHFPDRHGGETPIPSEAEAWHLAQQFAAKTKGKCVNLYVIRASDFTPVADYQHRKISNR